MKLRTIGEVIARREYCVPGDDDSRLKVEVGKPRKFSDRRDYYCAFKISTGASQEIRYAAGVDSVQALELGLHMIGIELKYIFNKDRKLRWLDTSDKDLHWPNIRPQKYKRAPGAASSAGMRK